MGYQRCRHGFRKTLASVGGELLPDAEVAIELKGLLFICCPKYDFGDPTIFLISIDPFLVYHITVSSVLIII